MADRKKITYNLKYYEKGKEQNIFLNIRFISNGVFKKHQDIIATANKATKLIGKTDTVISERCALIEDKKEGWEDEAKKLDNDIEVLTKEIEEFKKTDFFKERIELIFKILEQNGIENDELYTHSFWDDKIDPGDINSFLSAAVYKDYDTDIFTKTNSMIKKKQISTD